MIEIDLKLERELLLAIERNELSLSYQALVDFQTGKITAFETFLRWTHSHLGSVSASKFIPIAEATGYIHTLGEWVTKHVCQDIRAAIDAGIQLPPVALNFSQNQFKDSKILNQLNKNIHEYHLTPANISIEITESALLDNSDNSLATLNQLKERGYSIALDDFGTGHSSLSFLKSFSFDKVKIDKGFIENLVVNSQDKAIVEAVVGMAHSLGIKVVAKGVETEAQCVILRDKMIDEIQGYYFSRPQTWKDVLSLFTRNECLPEHLLRFTENKKTLLLVDDETNILMSLKRLLRRDGYEIITANSGQEGLAILENRNIDVIVSDQRMPNMTGVEFLGHVKKKYPDTIRIVLSGYTELNSVTDAINEGSIFRFLTKPWDDDKLREYIQEAFLYKNLADTNRNLSLKVQTSNQELASANRRLSDFIEHKQQQFSLSATNLDVVLDVLRYIPCALIGLDQSTHVSFINEKAVELFNTNQIILGEGLNCVIPVLYEHLVNVPENESRELIVGNKKLNIYWTNMEVSSTVLKKIIFLKETFE